MRKFDNFNILVKLAWRSVWKNKRRTTLTLLTVTVGAAMILFTNAMATGSHEKMIEDAVAANVGHIQIHEKGFWDKKTIKYILEDGDVLVNELKNNLKKISITKRIEAGALLALKDSTYGVRIQGVDVENEKKVSNLHTKIVKGRYLKANEKKSVVIGETLGKNLNVKLGSKLAMLSANKGSRADELLTVVGMFKSGNPAYDNGLALITFEQADETFFMEGTINSIVIRTEDTRAIEANYHKVKKIFKEKESHEIKAALNEFRVDGKITKQSFVEAIYKLNYIPGLTQLADLKSVSEVAQIEEVLASNKVAELKEIKRIVDKIEESKLGVNNYTINNIYKIMKIYSGYESVRYEVLDWAGLMPELVQYIVMDDFGAYIFDVVLFVVIAFGILNTIQMSVFERTREFGIMLAIGTKPEQVKWMIMIESVFITILGVATGLLFGWGICEYLRVNPMDFSAYADEMAVWGISTTIFPAILTKLNVAVTSALIFCLSLIFTYFPAHRAAKLKPIKAIKQL
jgi:ABC-type lipoprotein release transport system permease subunit